MIYTSYFAAMRKMTNEQKKNCISISRFTPKGIIIPRYTLLAPSAMILSNYKMYKDELEYTIHFTNHLNRLDIEKIYRDLDGKILLCYESPEKFCHRHLVAKWFNDHGFECKELEFPKPKPMFVQQSLF